MPTLRHAQPVAFPPSLTLWKLKPRDHLVCLPLTDLYHRHLLPTSLSLGRLLCGFRYRSCSLVRF
jgi:hypothetical protein